MFAVEVHAVDPYPLVHARTQALRVLEEDQVELRPVDVERVVAVHPRLVTLVEEDLGGTEVVRGPAEPERVDPTALGGGPCRTVLLGEPGRLDAQHRARLQ